MSKNGSKSVKMCHFWTFSGTTFWPVLDHFFEGPKYLHDSPGTFSKKTVPDLNWPMWSRTLIFKNDPILDPKMLILDPSIYSVLDEKKSRFPRDWRWNRQKVGVKNDPYFGKKTGFSGFGRNPNIDGQYVTKVTQPKNPENRGSKKVTKSGSFWCFSDPQN